MADSHKGADLAFVLLCNLLKINDVVVTGADLAALEGRLALDNRGWTHVNGLVMSAEALVLSLKLVGRGLPLIGHSIS